MRAILLGTLLVAALFLAGCSLLPYGLPPSSLPPVEGGQVEAGQPAAPDAIPAGEAEMAAGNGSLDNGTQDNGGGWEGGASQSGGLGGGNRTGNAGLPPKNLHMIFFDVGMADATLIKAGNKTVLVDAGGAGGQALLQKLSALGIKRIDLLVVSSWDAQKTGGVGAVLRELGVDEVWVSREVPANFVFETVREQIERQEVLVINPKAGDVRDMGGVLLRVYNPQKQEYPDNADANSIVMRVEYGDFCAFLPSDLEHAMEQPVVAQLDGRKCQVYKWRNNGEGRPQPSVLFDRVAPLDVVISVGPNEKGLPSDTTIERLGIARAGIYRTDTDGDVYVNASANGSYAIRTRVGLQNLTGRLN